MQFREKGDILFVGLIVAVLFAGSLIVIQSRKYTESLRKINPDYQFPTLLGMLKSTSILTFILFLLKLSFEKIFYYLNECILLDKYKNNPDKKEKNKYKRKLAIYGLKFFHYLIITIHSYFVYDKLDFFPYQLFGHGNMNNMYARGAHSFCFFERPKYFDFHYLLNLAYTFADLFCVVFIYDSQSDILVMVFHHLVTISLIVFSYYNHYDSIGALILFLHNFSDIFVYLGRAFLYAKLPTILKKLITITLLSFFVYCRLYVYGLLIHGFFAYYNLESFHIKFAFQICLISLYILHCTWTYKLIKIVYNSVTKATFDDSRKFIKEKKEV
jgi:ceramide synthetase